MADWHERKETLIKAAPEAVFAIVGDFLTHRELAGSGELVDVRMVTDGPTGLGSVIEADEAVDVGGQHAEYTARAMVVTYDPPATLSWVNAPPFPVRRVQWWFHLSPEGPGTRVVNEVEVDLGDGGRAMFGGVEGFKSVRAPDISKGMATTLENLRKMVEG